MAKKSFKCTVYLQLYTAEGTQHRLEVDAPGCTVSDLKCRIKELLAVPVQCQKLIFRDVILEDSTWFPDVCEDGGPSGLMLVISFGDIYATLQNGDMPNIEGAVTALLDGGGRFDDVAIETLVARLQNELNADVRIAVVNALVRIARQGDARVVEPVCDRMSDPIWEVGKAAMDAIPQLVQKGNRCAIFAALAVLQDVDNRILGKLESDSGLAMRLEHQQWEVRREALKVLSLVSVKNDAVVIDGVLACLQDTNRSVRKTAVEVLPQLTEIANETAISALAACLEDRDCHVMKSARISLVQIAGMGNEHAIMSVAARLQHLEWSVKCAALEGLCHIVEKGNGFAVRTVSNHLQHEDSDVRCIAIEALAEVAACRDETAANSIISCLTDKDGEVRYCALEALPKIAVQGDKRAIRATTVCLQDSDPDVREAAKSALDILKGNTVL